MCNTHPNNIIKKIDKSSWSNKLLNKKTINLSKYLPPFITLPTPLPIPHLCSLNSFKFKVLCLSKLWRTMENWPALLLLTTSFLMLNTNKHVLNLFSPFDFSLSHTSTLSHHAHTSKPLFLSLCIWTHNLNSNWPKLTETARNTQNSSEQAEIWSEVEQGGQLF